MIKLIKNEIFKTGIFKIFLSYCIFTFIIIFIYIFNDYSIEYISLYKYVMFIGIYSSILFGSIISGEIENGTFRFYLTKPFKRWKIYLAKLITIIIYILSVMFLLIIIYILLTKRIDTKSILIFLKNCIPLLLHSVIILLLSTVFRSVSLSTSIYLFLIIFGISISQLFLSFDLNFILYTFLPYLDFGIFQDFVYLEINDVFNVSISMNKGIIINMLYFVLIYLFGNYLFIKKDIKN